MSMTLISMTAASWSTTQPHLGAPRFGRNQSEIGASIKPIQAYGAVLAGVCPQSAADVAVQGGVRFVGTQPHPPRGVPS